MSVKKAVSIFGLVFLVNHVFSQDIINQGFEVNTGTVGTNYMYLMADTFESKVPNCFSAGDFPNLDLISGWGNAFGPYSGDWFVGVTPVDLLTMELTFPLTAGNSYTITFFDMSKEIANPIEIGVSDHPHTFGDLVYTTTQAPLVFNWQMRICTFIAPSNGLYISIRQIPGKDPRLWLGIDQLTIDPNQPCNKELQLGTDLKMCPGVPITLQATGSTFASYVWNDLSTEPTKEITQPGTYILTGTIGACSASDTIIITAGEVPDINFQSDIQSGCAPLDVIFSYTGEINPGYTFQWNFGDGNITNGLDIINHPYSLPSCHPVSLMVISGDLCSATLTKDDYICVLPSPVAQFESSPEHIFVDHPEVFFTNHSIENITNEWDFGDGFSSAEIHPVHIYPLHKGGDYKVRLAVTSESGCTDTIWQTVTVKFPFNIYTPNAFSPDGDFLNPIFKPLVSSPFDVEEYRLEIYDRWGEQIFVSSKLVDGWDGNASPSDVYIWKVMARNPYDHKQILQTGHVTLMR